MRCGRNSRASGSKPAALVPRWTAAASDDSVAPEFELEAALCSHFGRHPRAQPGHNRRILLAEEAKRHVQRLRSQPAKRAGVSAQPLAHTIGGEERCRTQSGVELDSKEEPHPLTAQVPPPDVAPGLGRRSKLGPSSATPSSSRRTQSSAICAVIWR